MVYERSQELKEIEALKGKRIKPRAHVSL